MNLENMSIRKTNKINLVAKSAKSQFNNKIKSTRVVKSWKKNGINSLKNSKNSQSNFRAKRANLDLEFVRTKNEKNYQKI